MAIRIYNSQSHRKEEFKPITPGKVLMYVCGVTVYDDPHVGHARCYTAFDAMVRHFKSKGLEVEYVRNFTDIDDKIINRANELGEGTKELAERYIESFSQDMETLGVLPANLEPKATEHIAEIIAGIETLVAKGHAYEVEGDVYFAVHSFADYGKLSGRNLEDMQAGARVAVDERKKNPMDFALWKSSKPGEPFWPSPWGEGRPGWHIECSVMSQKYLGKTFDIHGGGEDLIFPHHENEVAQAEAISGQPFAHYWVHNGFVRVNQEKMSKSLGNFFTIKDILKTVRPEVLRLFLLSKHYRSPLDFSDAALKEAGQGLERLYRALGEAEGANEEPVSQTLTFPVDKEYQAEIDKAVEAFEQAMDDDFNTGGATGCLFTLAKIINRLAADKIRPERDALMALAGKWLRLLGGRLGILQQEPEEFLKGSAGATDQDGPDPAWIEEMIEKRAQARKAKDFAQADAIRDELGAKGVILEDSPQGTTWVLKG